MSKKHININAPIHGTLIIGDNNEPELARQIETLAKEKDILLTQLKQKDELIHQLDLKLKELEK